MWEKVRETKVMIDPFDESKPIVEPDEKQVVLEL